MRSFLIQNTSISHIIDTTESFIESGVSLESMIIILDKQRLNQDPLLKTGYIVNASISSNNVDRCTVQSDKKYGIWLNINNVSIVEKIKSKSIK
jgi:hypothetical protein